MKKEILINSDKRHVLVQVHTAATLLATGVAGEETQDAANAGKLRVSAKLVRAGVTGAYILKEGPQAKPFYIVEDGVIKFAMPDLPIGYNRLTIVLQYGTNEPSVLVVDVNVLPDATAGEWFVHDEYDFNAVKTVGGAGGLKPNEYGGYEIGENAHATAEGALAHGYEVRATGEYSHAEGYGDDITESTDVEIEKMDNAQLAIMQKYKLPFNYINYGDDIGDNLSGYDILKDGVKVAFLKASAWKSDSAWWREWEDEGYDSGDFLYIDGNIPSGTYDFVRTPQASGDCSHAEGDYTTASGNCSHAEGNSTTASGYSSHAEGESTTASGNCSHAEGNSTTASGYSSHAEGNSTTASGYCSHAEGESTTASGYASHAEGESTTASGYASHAEGEYTKANGDYQHAQGRYNNVDDFDEDSCVFMHGCGNGDNERKNAFAIAYDGKVYVIGLGGYDGTNHEDALSLQDLFGTSNIQASKNKRVNNYDVPDLTPAQVTAAYNAAVAGRYVTITDATGNYHLGVTQADVLNGDLAISLIFLNVMLLTYEISGSTVDVQFKNL